MVVNPQTLRKFEISSQLVAKGLGCDVNALMDSFARAREEDFAAIMTLREAGFGLSDEQDGDVIKWKYFDYSKYDSDIYVLYVGDRLIGVLGAEPINLLVCGEVIAGVKVGDITVDREYAKVGVGGWMLLYMQVHFPVVIAMGANKNSYTMVRRLFKPVDCRHHFKFLFSSKGYLSVKGLPGAISWIFDVLILRNFCRIFFRTLPKFDVSYTVGLEESVDLAELVGGAIVNWHSRLCAFQRSLEFMRWRFTHNPKSRFRYLTIRKEGELCAFAIFKVGVGASTKILAVMDWGISPLSDKKELLNKLFSELLRRGFSMGVESLQVMAADNESIESLKACRYSLREVEEGLYVYGTDNIKLSLYEKENWFLSYADTDEMV